MAQPGSACRELEYNLLESRYYLASHDCKKVGYPNSDSTVSAPPLPASGSSSPSLAMNIAHSLPSTVAGISFSFLTTEDIRRISVKQIVNPILLDDLNRPNIGGLYDPALGPSDRQDMYVVNNKSYCVQKN